jgi:hypothetical protein
MILALVGPGLARPWSVRVLAVLRDDPLEASLQACSKIVAPSPSMCSLYWPPGWVTLRIRYGSRPRHSSKADPQVDCDHSQQVQRVEEDPVVVGPAA